MVSLLSIFFNQKKLQLIFWRESMLETEKLINFVANK
jgi:hypothetical protein